MEGHKNENQLLQTKSLPFCPEGLLEQAQAELAIKVKVRTAELTKANEDLRMEISERRRVEQALRESEARYRSLFEESPLSLWEEDFSLAKSYIDKLKESGIEDLRAYFESRPEAVESCAAMVKVVDVNRATLKLYGAKDIGQLRQGLSLVFEKESYDVFREELVAISEGKTHFESEAVTRALNGERNQVILTWSVALGYEQTFKKVLISIIDITARKLAEEALRESQQRYQAIIQDQTELICRFLSDGTLTFVNEAYCRYFGKSQEELVGQSFMPLIPAEDQERVKENLNLLNLDNPAMTHEHRVIAPDGQIRWQQWTNRAIFDQEGRFIEYQAVGRDITERKKTEDTLRQGEKFLSDMFSSIQDGISILDKEMNIVRVNPAMEAWYAHAMPLIGKKCYAAYHCRSRPCEVCPTRVTIEKGQADYKVVPKTGADGKIIGWLDLYSFPLIDTATGLLKGVIEYVRDITDRKQAEERSTKLNTDLVRSNKRLRQLALRDSQTGLYNHHYLADVIEAEFHRAKRYYHSLAVTMLDIDYFKSINDVYGHQFGDLVLKQLSRQLKRLVRRYDILIRFGGEEFVIVSPGIDRPQALTLAQRLLDAFNLYNFGNRKHSVKLKLSLAVASYPEDKIVNGIDLIDLTSEILNKVKEFGGNRVYSSLDIEKQKQAVSGKNREPAEIRSLKNKIDKLTKRGNQSLVESIFAFAKTIELKDHHTGEHTERTVHYVTEIAKALNLPKEETELIRQAAMLHDLGKIGISEKILLKKARLTPREFSDIKKHPQIGADILRPVQFLHGIIPFIFYHHERWDGRGYPAGLKAEEIPLGARIIALADVYQALISDRPYRRAYSKDKALTLIKKGSGTQFDPSLVSTFLKILHEER